jgi:hypothetical protein
MLRKLLMAAVLLGSCAARPQPVPPQPKSQAPVKLYIVPKLIGPQPGEIIIRSGPVWHPPEAARSHDPFVWAKDNRSIA